ncbi:hypothetical protein FB451DRAFT_1369820 [Mycena latifolia]|nr:hypothetical protein FB451DRAFT_1369820 [Mycena latifolia]
MSLVEQETPEVASWFFTADFSGVVRLGFAGFFVALVVAIFWSDPPVGTDVPTYADLCRGMTTIHPPILYGISVGIIGLVVLILLAFATFRLLGLLPRLRKSFNTLRFPGFHHDLSRRSDWVPNRTELLVFNG